MLSAAATVPDSTSPLHRQWRLGEIVDADIVTPVSLTVSNPNPSQAELAEAIQRVPAVFRHDVSQVGVAETALREQFVSARRQFVALLEAGFRQSILQSVGDLSDPRFLEAVTVFRSRQPGFPLSTNLAELWALGDEGKVVLDDLAAQLRRFMTVYLRADALPGGESLAGPFVRVVPAAVDGTAGISEAQTSALILRDNLFSISRYQGQLAELAPASENTMIRFVTGFLHPNCVFDESSTRLAREREVAEMMTVANYHAGSVLARQGQTVDTRLLRALAALRAAPPGSSDRGYGWTIALGSAVIGALMFAGLRWRRHRRWRTAAAWAVVPANDAAGADAEAWRERALVAEARAEKATAMLRTNLLPHLARWMMSELLQRLLSQRSVAQTTAQRAETEVAELAERLAKLHAPMEERRRAYEKRIAELEGELAARDEQDRELIQARIESTRRRLEADRPNDGAWN